MAFLLLGCPAESEPATPCIDINVAAAEEVCVHRLPEIVDFERLSGLWRDTPLIKFLIPAREGLPMPRIAYISPNAHELHREFMRERLPEAYATLDEARYIELVFNSRELRHYYAGTISHEDGQWVFRIGEDRFRPQSAIRRSDVLEVWEALDLTFFGSLSFAPLGERQNADARTWTDLPFPIYGTQGNYEAYSQGRACGIVQVVTLGQLQQREAEGQISFRDILIMSDTPADLAFVVSGTITAVPQGPLSHLTVRASSRGTPNAYIRDAHDVFQGFDSELICLDIRRDDYTIERTDRATAEAFWEQLQPDPITLPPPILDNPTLVELRALATDTTDERAQARRTYGAKGTNLAILYQRIERYDSYRGLLIPAHYYARFMNERGWSVDLGEGTMEHNFAETVRAWSETDSSPDWPGLHDAMISAEVPADILELLHARIVEVYGSPRIMVRFRSSSNAEDGAEFSGAGLYSSTSVCPADEFDSDTVGPSLCDPDKENERTLSRGLTRVWASLWSARAVEERAWFSIDSTQVVMAILVNDRAGDERANMVAFSANPLNNEDDRTFISAQVGDVDLVRPPNGVRAEHWLIDRGRWELTRLGRSTETDGDVLSEVQAREIAVALSELEDFPFDLDLPANTRILLDSEWKVLSDGTMVIKQIRPFVDLDTR